MSTLASPFKSTGQNLFLSLDSPALVSPIEFGGAQLSPSFGLEHFFKPLKIGIGDLRLHRAVLGTTHRAELRLLVDVGGQSFIVIFLGPLRIERQLKLLVPVEGVAGPAELIVAVAGTRTMTGDISSCLLYTSPSPRDKRQSRMPSSA